MSKYFSPRLRFLIFFFYYLWFLMTGYKFYDTINILFISYIKYN